VGTTVVLALAELGVSFVALKQIFALPTSRAFGLFGINLLWSCVLFVTVLCLIRPYVAEGFEIPTVSMSPTLVPLDRIFADKLASPRRGDLVLYHPLVNGEVQTVIYCKRLVGLPGDRVRIQGRDLFVNDRLAAAWPAATDEYTPPPPHFYYADGLTTTLASDELFFVGDNCAVSYDSRFVGPSKLSAVVGVADFIYWPLNRFRCFR
jgi:signal peptidase I